MLGLVARHVSRIPFPVFLAALLIAMMALRTHALPVVAAWLGLTPKQHSSGGKERLGRTSKMGERSLRRLLILGASSAVKVAARDNARAGPWLAGMLARKPRMLVTVALANKMARIVWALMARGGIYQSPVAAA